MLLPRPATRSQPIPAPRALRWHSERDFLGLPWLAIAVGPDPARGEIRGHARGVLAIGDIATGVIAIGGFARGLIAVGGFAVGALAIGGLAVGGLAVGGAALGVIALGGGALGIVAMGGGALGVYAIGGAAYGEHVISPLVRDPLALEWLRSLPFLDSLDSRPRR